MALSEGRHRPAINFPPSIWGDQFSSFSLDKQEYEKHANEIQVLKQKTRCMLMDSDNKPRETMNLINTIGRLGLSYHFEEEIEEKLQQIFDSCCNFEEDFEDYDLSTVALYFRLFRQHGYKMPCGIFNKFVGNDCKFKETLKSDVKGMLSLYEVAHLRIHGEDILDEALAFTTTHLESIIKTTCIDPFLAKQVRSALEQPLHKNFPRIATREYICFYEEDESKNDLLLRFSKLDFNMLQMLHKQELCDITRWWKKLDLTSKLPYIRDRVVEIYFWAVGLYFEPQWSRARTMASKAVAMLAIADETYDSYGTMEELELFVDAVERWDMSAIKDLPDYMKIVYTSFLKVYEEYDVELAKEGRTYASDHCRQRMIELVRGYHTEARWVARGAKPTFMEYEMNGLITGGYFLNAAALFMGMGELASKEFFDWLLTKPKILVAGTTIARFLDDVGTYEVEKETGQANYKGIELYMEEYGVSKDEAMHDFRKKAEDAWKTMNEEMLKPTPFSTHLLVPILNLARLLFVSYNKDDGYTHPERVLKNHIIGFFVDPLVVKVE